MLEFENLKNKKFENREISMEKMKCHDERKKIYYELLTDLHDSKLTYSF